MSSGIITIAHNSAGPKMDIIGPSPDPTGYLAGSAEDYSKFVIDAMTKYEHDYHRKMQDSSRKWIKD